MAPRNTKTQPTARTCNSRAMEALLSLEIELCINLCSLSKRENSRCNAKFFADPGAFNMRVSVVRTARRSKNSVSRMSYVPAPNKTYPVAFALRLPYCLPPTTKLTAQSHAPLAPCPCRPRLLRVGDQRRRGEGRGHVHTPRVLHRAPLYRGAGVHGPLAQAGARQVGRAHPRRLLHGRSAFRADLHRA